MVSLKEFIGESGEQKAAPPEGAPAPRDEAAPPIIPRAEHGISRKQISQAALRVLYGLKDAGYQAYLVGGGIRDLLLGREPKDFDVTTDARPEEVRRIFRNSRLIGRRFILVHVHFQGEIIEVATFRGSGASPALDDETPEEGEDQRELMVQDESGRLLADNVYGNMEEDAFRRDFSVNALYYNIADFSLVDYVGGLEDLRAGRLRVIGDPASRYREDPVRMLRAVRFAAKLGFRMSPETEAPLRELGHLLRDVPPARLFDETLKLFLSGHAVESYELLRHYDLFQHLFPATEAALAQEVQHFPLVLLMQALSNTDERVQMGKAVTPAFLFAALLWEPVRLRAAELQAAGLQDGPALQQAATEVVQEQIGRVAIPKRFSVPMREIWELQPRFSRRGGRRPFALLAHPRFRAAYDFLLLRAASGEADEALAQWWTAFQEADDAGRGELVRTAKHSAGAEEGPAGPLKSKRRRRRRARPRPAPESSAS